MVTTEASQAGARQDAPLSLRGHGTFLPRRGFVDGAVAAGRQRTPSHRRPSSGRQLGRDGGDPYRGHQHRQGHLFAPTPGPTLLNATGRDLAEALGAPPRFPSASQVSSTAGFRLPRTNIPRPPGQRSLHPGNRRWGVSTLARSGKAERVSGLSHARHFHCPTQTPGTETAMTTSTRRILPSGLPRDL